MNLQITVKMILVMFLLCSGLSDFTFGSNRLRVFRFPDNENEPDWDGALSECNKANESFVTLYDEEDANFVANFSDGKQRLWLGLRKGRNITWSDGVPVTFNATYEIEKAGTQICVAIDNNTWTSLNCSERKPFMCNKDGNYTLYEDEKNWCKALQYCRHFSADLVSISNESQNDEVIKKGNNTSFWIGLMHDEWEWADKSCSLYRNWDTESALLDPIEKCTISTALGLLKNQECPNSQAFSFCSKGKTRIRVIDHHLTWERAFDYCKANHTGMLQIENENDQKAVEQWLNNTDVTGPFWIGLRQSRVFGFWIWRDRTVTYSKWKNGTEPKLPMSNHCGAINQTEWSDEHCWRRLPFLCEEKIIFMN
ncbi:hypothetical protein PFLUV_G00264980 [Perca fluviatilis]|uniref:C-type lectin domain-containing protein n=1 Tax=Perca fluviatilis TaxID=8168 RepID=A0A6A5E2Y8_PERFL|nr:lymphocyte antigen 75-like [Perca fluviatilis]KAF1372399.1 hypothetical protein PFLUV_G00264980 [Perca fluviatilis]